MKVTVPDNGCYGIETQDGRKFNADRSGHVSVPDRYAGELASSTAGQLGLLNVNTNGTTRLGGVLVDPNERTCPRCHFAPWPWQKRCPRDGAKFVKVNA